MPDNVKVPVIVSPLFFTITSLTVIAWVLRANNPVPWLSIVIALCVVAAVAILLYVVPSLVVCHVSVVSFHLNATFVDVPRSISIPAFSLGVPVTSLFNIMMLSFIVVFVVCIAVALPLTVRLPVIVVFPVIVALPPTAKLPDTSAAPFISAAPFN